jgi:hypothetical protein
MPECDVAALWSSAVQSHSRRGGIFDRYDFWVPCLHRLGGKHASRFGVRPTISVPHDPSPLRAASTSGGRRPPPHPLFRSPSSNGAVLARCAPSKHPLPTPARKIRARTSHVSIFQNEGSALAPRAKTPRNPTPGSSPPSLAKLGKCRVCLKVVQIHPLVFRAQIVPKCVSDHFRNPIAESAQQNPVGWTDHRSAHSRIPNSPK